MSLEIMLDLEWMGKPPSAAITAIAAVAICRETLAVLGDFSIAVSLESSMSYGMTVDADTILWWLGQSKEAQAQFIDNSSACDLHGALLQLNSFIDHHIYSDPDAYRPLTKVWGYGATADNEVLKFAYAACGIGKPWSFRVDKCFRTRMDDFPNAWVNYGTPHVAADDAMAQALTLIETYKA